MRALPRLLRVLVPVSLLAAGVVGFSTSASAATAPAADAVVVAVIDSGISPYHWDFLASKMPQARTKAALPLTKSPDTWLPGFPKKSAFTTFNRLDLTLDSADESRRMSDLHAKDAKKWASVKYSGPSARNYYWFPGTKLIGAMSFDYESQTQKTVDTADGYKMVPIYGSGGAEHGQGTTSVSVGNMHGTCPECLLVFLQAGDTAATERALAWAQSQPWIDVVSNSYGLQTVPTGAVRDGLYGGPVDQQRKASERGQSIVFSAGNGIENAFAVPFSTLTSSVKGPDWVITVGATTPAGKDNYTGSGKPVDLSGIGSGYPSAYGSTTVSNGGKFSGTSNAAPTISGTYARGLWVARKAMAGPSRIQSGGVISVGKARCGKARPNCEIGDGKLTAVELRDRLFKGAKSINGGMTPAGVGSIPRVADEHYAAEGYGTYFARLKADDERWLAEFDQLAGPLLGTRAPLARPADEKDWFIVDSWCRQHIFGAWKDGAWKTGQAIPGPSASAPVREAYYVACQPLTKLPIPVPLP